jgi:hypothetical protein
MVHTLLPREFGTPLSTFERLFRPLFFFSIEFGSVFRLCLCLGVLLLVLFFSIFCLVMLDAFLLLCVFERYFQGFNVVCGSHLATFHFLLLPLPSFILLFHSG